MSAGAGPGGRRSIEQAGATQLGYRAGVRVNLDVFNSQTQLFATQRDLAQAPYNVLLGGLRLRQACGQLAPVDVASVNRLLQP